MSKKAELFKELERRVEELYTRERDQLFPVSMRDVLDTADMEKRTAGDDGVADEPSADEAASRTEEPKLFGDRGDALPPELREMLTRVAQQSENEVMGAALKAPQAIERSFERLKAVLFELEGSRMHWEMLPDEAPDCEILACGSRLRQAEFFYRETRERVAAVVASAMRQVNQARIFKENGGKLFGMIGGTFPFFGGSGDGEDDHDPLFGENES